jgi:hypothetical protein
MQCQQIISEVMASTAVGSDCWCSMTYSYHWVLLVRPSDPWVASDAVNVISTVAYLQMAGDLSPTPAMLLIQH